MSFYNDNLLVSLVLLQNQGITPDKAIPASIGAALIPGPLGLIIPLAVANQDSGGTATTDNQKLVRVPDVTEDNVDDAKKQLEDKKLIVSLNSVFVDDAAISKGEVIEQDPEGDKFVPEGTKVTLTVSLGPSPDSDETSELDTIRKDVEENAKKLDQVLDAINKSVAAKVPTSTRPTPGVSG